MFESFAGELLRRVKAEFAADGHFAGGVDENVGRAFGEDAVSPSPRLRRTSASRVDVGEVGSAGVPPAGFGVSPKPFRGSRNSVKHRLPNARNRKEESGGASSRTSI